MKKEVVYMLICLFLQGSLSGQELRRWTLWGAGFDYPTLDNPGLKVVNVAEQGPFDKAGLKNGDVILKIDEIKMTDPTTFLKKRRSVKHGDEPRLLVSRGKNVFETTFSPDPYPKEEIADLDILYDELTTAHGDRLRTIISKPKGVDKPMPVVLLVQWLSCGTVEAYATDPDGWTMLAHDISRAGYVVFRVEKPGVGDSEGPDCSEYGFEYELETHRASIQKLRAYSFIDTTSVVFFGGSMGGAKAALLAEEEPNLKGLLVSGTHVRSWYEKMLDEERRRLALKGMSYSEINAQMNDIIKLYSMYLVDGLSMKEIFREEPSLRKVWHGIMPEHLIDHQYGRPLSYYQEVQHYNFAEYWERVEVPVLAVYGEYDYLTMLEDHQLIVDIVNKTNPGLARLHVHPKMDHNFNIYKSQQHAFDSYSVIYDRSISEIVVNWLNEIAFK